MEDNSQMQQQEQMQQLEKQQLCHQQQQKPQECEQSEDMNAISEECVANICELAVDETSYMCIQEECEQLSIDADKGVDVDADADATAYADADAEVEVEAEADVESQGYLNYQQQYQRHHNNNRSHRQYNSKKSVSFKTLVDIFQLSDAWQLHVKKSSLKTEEDQAKRRILQRNY